MRRVTTTGRTVEEAVTSALVKLGVTKSQANIRVIQEPVKGLFGIIGGKEAEVEVAVRMEPDELAKEFLRKTIHLMGVDASVLVRNVEEDGRSVAGLEVVCNHDDLPVVIGRHGSTLDALQYLANLTANRETEDYVKIHLDAGDYRQRRTEGLHRLAERAAIRAVRSGRSVVLEAMTASERKVIHTYLQDRHDVTTTSEGVDPNRKVVVIPSERSGSAD